jgi:UDP-N-acetyl-D-mannosaminuronate dehydrogenase
VVAVDVKREVVDAVNSGVSPVREPGLQELVERNVVAGRLRASLNSQVDFHEIDAVIISVQTPIYKGKKPNLFFFPQKTLEAVGRSCHNGMLVIISSTIPLGVMTNLVKQTDDGVLIYYSNVSIKGVCRRCYLDQDIGYV